MSERAPEVVMVDHDLEALKALVEPLRREVEFYLTISGNDALAMLARHPVGVIVAGQTLFSGTGIEVLVHARRRSPRTTRVLLANAVERRACESAIAAAELFQILKRPCTPEQLKELLQAASWTAQLKPEGAQVEHIVMETGEHRQIAESASGAPVTVLTTDADLFDSIRSAVHGQHDVHLATRHNDAVELAAAGQCAILITDQALSQAALERITQELRSREPAMVTIAAGNREQGNALIGLLGSGVIHRFLLKPVTAGLARLSIDSAARQHAALKVHPLSEPKPHPRAEHRAQPHAEPRAPPAHEPVFELAPIAPAPTAGTARPDEEEDVHTFPPREARGPAFWLSKGAAVAAIVAIAAALWWAFAGRGPTIDPRQVAIDRAIAAADQAFRAGQLIEPADASALHYYRRALEIDPQHAKANAGVNRIAEHFIREAETHLVEGELAAAADALDVIRHVHPAHKRLRFLDAQLKKEQEELLALQAHQSATSGNLQAAQDLLTQAEQLGSGSSGEVAAAQAALSEQEHNRQVGRLLDSARLRLAQGRLVSPANDSAKFYLGGAQRAAPDNLAVQQGMRDLQERVIAEADAALQARRLDSARNWINEARELGVDRAQLAQLQGRLTAAETQDAKSNLLALTVRRTQENRLVEPAQDSARFYLARLVEMDPSFPGVQGATTALGAKLVGRAQSLTAQRQFDDAGRMLAEAQQLGYAGPDLAAAEAALRSARESPQSRPTQAEAVAPRRIRAVPPRYPQDALQEGLQGWVDVSFRVTREGNVAEARVEAAQPGNRFDRAALTAVRQWKFEPSPENAPEYTQRLRTRVEFKLEE
jgi:protein TonB